MGTILRGIVAYFTLLFLLRVTSRRAIGPGTPIELILIFLFGGMTVQAIVSDDRSLTNAVIGVTTVAWLHVMVSMAKRRWSKLGLLVDGSPVVLVEGGHWHTDRIAKLRLHEQDVMASARQSGLQTRDQIANAIYERNGDIAVFGQDGR
jgi:uncharacterized membrane protein YcaP (DUF421 family)